MESVSDWSGLLPELVAHTASFFTLTEDFMALRGVCAAWRAAAAAATKTVSKIPLLMLGEKDGSYEREFYSLSKQKICLRTAIPGTKGKRCIDAGFGWILTSAPSDEVCLLKPFSSTARIQLPNIKTFRSSYVNYSCYPGLSFVQRAVLTANPSETSHFVLLVTTTTGVGLWKPGDGSWTSFAREPVCCYKGKVYELVLGSIVSWVPYAGTDFINSPVILPLKNVPPVHCERWNVVYYLVESTDGELLLIIRLKGPLFHDINGCVLMHSRTTEFRVMRVDFVEGECKKVDGLGRDAVFVGNNVAVSVAATDFPGVLKPNCIYFTDDCPGSYVFCPYCGDSGFEDKIRCVHHKHWGSDTGIYNLEGRRVERFDVEFTSRVGSPQWIF